MEHINNHEKAGYNEMVRSSNEQSEYISPAFKLERVSTTIGDVWSAKVKFVVDTRWGNDDDSCDGRTEETALKTIQEYRRRASKYNDAGIKTNAKVIEP